MRQTKNGTTLQKVWYNYFEKIVQLKGKNMRKSLVALMAIIVVLSITLTACKSESGQNIVSKALGIDVSSGNEVSTYDTHSGNGDGTSCIALSFNDDTVLEKIKNNTIFI